MNHLDDTLLEGRAMTARMERSCRVVPVTGVGQLLIERRVLKL
jgi:hypothetical protein